MSGFKRVHFFKYHLREDDWQDRHRFHWEKHQLHQVEFHGWGIVPEERGELLIRQRGRGEMAVEVLDGFGVDASGRDIYMPDARVWEVDRDDYYLPCTLYWVVTYDLEPVELRRLKDGTKNNKYHQEIGKIEVITDPPKEHQIELARVHLTEDAYKITDARDPMRPRDNEIDLRYRRYCRVYKGLDPKLKYELIKAIKTRRHAYIRVGGNRLLRPAAAMSHCLGSLQMIVENDMLNRKSATSLLDAINKLDNLAVDLIRDESQDPWVEQRPEFASLAKNAGAVHSLLDGPMHYKLDNLDSIIGFLNRDEQTLPAAASTYGDESLVYYPGQEPVLAKTYPLSDEWERVKTWSAEFPEQLFIDGMTWTLIGELDVTDEESEKKFAFKIHNAIDAWRTRQRNFYPDGTAVDDTGVAHEGGYSEYEVRRVVPDTHLAVIRMMDYARADFELEFVVNDQLVGVSQCLGADRRARWRNWPFVIPAWFVNDDVVRVKQLMNTAARDVNMFRYWFYQPLDFRPDGHPRIRSLGLARAWAALRATAKVFGIAVGLPLAILGAAALVGLGVDNLWVALGIGAALVVGLPLFVADRLLPEVDEHAGTAVLASTRGLLGDVLAIAWLALALATLAPPQTAGALHAQADRFDGAELSSVADATRWVAGARPS